MKYLILLVLLLSGCGGGGGNSNTVLKDCISGDRNCSNEDVDIISAIQYAVDNNISIVEIRWAGCCNDERYFEISQYAYENGVAVIWAAGDSGRILTFASPHMLVLAGKECPPMNTGPAIDFVLDLRNCRGSIHGTTHATAIAIKLFDTYPPQEALERLMSGDYEDFVLSPCPDCDYPDELWETSRTVLIVDNGFDIERPLYIVYRNPLLSGTVTGDYGIKAINELNRWVTGANVIGYVPYNTAPLNPVIGNWDVLD